MSSQCCKIRAVLKWGGGGEGGSEQRQRWISQPRAREPREGLRNGGGPQGNGGNMEDVRVGHGGWGAAAGGDDILCMHVCVSPSTGYSYSFSVSTYSHSRAGWSW